LGGNAGFKLVPVDKTTGTSFFIYREIGGKSDETNLWRWSDLVVNNIVAPEDNKELQVIIRKAISDKEKLLLKENLELNAPVLDEKTVVLDLVNLNKIIELDKDNFTVTVEGGINFLELQTLLAEKGFYFPMDTYASGHASLSYNVLHALPSYSLGEYGNYREYVLGIEAVLFNGDLINIGGKNIKNVSGLDIIGLMIGSQESFGIINNFTLRLLPLPEEKQVVICNFKDIKTAQEAALQLTNKGISPAKLLVVNTSGAQLLENTKITKSPLLIVELEGFKASMQRRVDMLQEIVMPYGAPCLIMTDNTEIKEVWNKFRENQYQLLSKTADLISFSGFYTKLPEMLTELDRELVKHCPAFTIIINSLIGSGMIIPLGKVGSDWHEETSKIMDEYQGKSLDKKSFKEPGMGIVQARLKAAFDPANISFFGGEKV